MPELSRHFILILFCENWMLLMDLNFACRILAKHKLTFSHVESKKVSLVVLLMKSLALFFFPFFSYCLL